MPRTITIDGLLVDDLLVPENERGFTILRDPIGPPILARLPPPSPADSSSSILLRTKVAALAGHHPENPGLTDLALGFDFFSYSGGGIADTHA